METRIVQAAIEGIGTPLYLFDEAEFHAQTLHLRSLLPEDVELCYAIKANSFIVEQAAHDAERIEVCSPGELRICQVLGIPAEKLVISGVYKDPSLMHELVGSWPEIARYTVESTRQFDLLEAEAASAGVRIPILIRLASDSQFGVDADEAKALASRCAGNPAMEFVGIQLFAGTQKTSTKRQQRELAKADALIAEIDRDCGVKVREFEYGAGLPVLYFDADGEAQRKQDDLASNLARLLGEMQFSGKVVIELGRAMAASCGTYATRIVDEKCSDGLNYAIVDGGKHQMVYYGNAMGMSQPPCTVLPAAEGGRDKDAIRGDGGTDGNATGRDASAAPGADGNAPDCDASATSGADGNVPGCDASAANAASATDTTSAASAADTTSAAGTTSAASATVPNEPKEWNICGSLCTTTDILAKKMPLGDIRVGDVLLFHKAGAYCMTEGVSLFLSRDLPAVVIAELDGNIRLARGHMDMYPANVPGHGRLG